MNVLVNGSEMIQTTNTNAQEQQCTVNKVKNLADIAKIDTKTEHDNVKSLKPKLGKNWQKVKNIVKLLKNNALVSTTKASQVTIGLLNKKQRLQQESQRALTVQRAKLCKYDCELINNSEIMKIETTLDEGILFKTYRPIPKIQYLINQPVGNGEVDTTGAWVWEAEETMAYFLTKIYRKYSNHHSMKTKILQLGAGCSGLAALTYARLWQSKNINQSSLHVVVTDGRQDNIFFLSQNIKANFPQKHNKITIQAEKYLWGNFLSNCEEFDLILAADCLFFEEFHEQLIKTLSVMLKVESGVCLFVNPKRGSSVINFLSKLNFWSQKCDQYCFKTDSIQFIDQKYQKLFQKARLTPNYNADVNQFMFLQVRKISKIKPNQKNLLQQ